MVCSPKRKRYFTMETNHFLTELLEAFHNSRKSFVGLFLALSLFCIFSFLSFSNIGGEYFLNVGQGDSQLILFPDSRAGLIDTGPRNGRAGIEAGRVLPFWQRSLAMIFLSHPDADHIGGTADILRRYRVGVIFTNGDESDSEIYGNFKNALAESGVREIVLSRGDRVQYGDAEFRVLWPPANFTGGGDERNDNSLVLLFSHAGRNSLYTGDVPEKIEKLFLTNVPLLDILKIGHHGSKYSTGEALLLKARPRVAIIGVGKNSYGHPAEEALERLKKFAVPVFRTDEQGTIFAPFSESLDIFSLQ